MHKTTRLTILLLCLSIFFVSTVSAQRLVTFGAAFSGIVTSVQTGNPDFSNRAPGIVPGATIFGVFSATGWWNFDGSADRTFHNGCGVIVDANVGGIGFHQGPSSFYSPPFYDALSGEFAATGNTEEGGGYSTYPALSEVLRFGCIGISGTVGGSCRLNIFLETAYGNDYNPYNTYLITCQIAPISQLPEAQSAFPLLALVMLSGQSRFRRLC
jgi:hypothetical protein